MIYNISYNIIAYLPILSKVILLNNSMKINDFIGEWKGKVPSSVCRSDKKLGASDEASCKSQGLRSRDSGKKHDGKTLRGKKVRGQKYGGPLKDYS
jgi:hypothetical protein